MSGTEECEHVWCVDLDIVFTSIPPKFRWKCVKCGEERIAEKCPPGDVSLDPDGLFVVKRDGTSNGTCPDENRTCPNESPDSREKTENDIFAAIKQAVGSGTLCGFGTIGDWLDRQAAITERECRDRKCWDYCETCELKEQIHELTAELKEAGYYRQENDKLQEQVMELHYELKDAKAANSRQAEKIKGVCSLNDELQTQVDELKSRNCPHYHVREHYCDVHGTRIAELQAQVDNLAADLHTCNREREKLREQLGIALDHAHETLALVDLDGEVVG